MDRVLKKQRRGFNVNVIFPEDHVMQSRGIFSPELALKVQEEFKTRAQDLNQTISFIPNKKVIEIGRFLLY